MTRWVPRWLALTPLVLSGWALAQPAGGQAVVVLVGEVGDEPTLSAVVAELLEYQGVSTRFVRQPAFDPAAALDRAPPDDAVWVFVDRRGGAVVDLTLRDPTGERFLLRELPLSAGLDPVGRELVAQAIESSVVALLQTDTGLSREQARRELALRGEPPTAALPDVESVSSPSRAAEAPWALVPPPPAASPAPAPQLGCGSSTTSGRFGVRYDVATLGADLGLTHGPGIELGVRVGQRWFGGWRFAFDHRWPQELQGRGLRAELRTSGVWLAPEVGWRDVRRSFLVSSGLGAAWTQVHPTEAPADVTLAAASTNWVPAVRMEARYALRIESLAVGVALTAEVPLLDTHYDLALVDGSVRLAEPMGVIPGSALTLGWEPRLSSAR